MNKIVCRREVGVNRTVGKISSLVTGLAVLSFAWALIAGLFVDSLFACCLIDDGCPREK